MKIYPIAEPNFSDLEKKYVNECLETGWVSSAGKFVKEFENEYAKFNETKYAISVSNGTVSLHLILLALGIRRGDEVIVPNFTYVAASNSVLHIGAKPIFVDCDPKTYNINEQSIKNHITGKTKAIIAVHLYGNPCAMEDIIRISKKYNIPIIEDAAEAHGALYKNKKVGQFGIANSFSFFGNKTITTGEGGMITTNSKKLFDKINLLKNQGQHHEDERYYHRIPGFNYRMTNIQAALGLAQLQRIQDFLDIKRKINSWYKKYLTPAINARFINFQSNTPNSSPSYWMNAVTIKTNINELSKQLKEENIITRPFFSPMHTIPYFLKKNIFPNSEKIFSKGLLLPSGTTLSEEDIIYISNKILEKLKKL